MLQYLEIYLLVSGLPAVWAIVIYNLLVRDKNRVLTAWSDIDVQLKRRHDLIPKLVEAVKHYADYESTMLTHITELRQQSETVADIARKGEVEQELAGTVNKLLAIAEDYPDLKASASYLDLQRNLTDVEQQLQYARRYYNGAVRNLNIRIESFPDMLVARLFGYRQAQFFQYEN
jgi:LemA protein